jgi:hypothetical protein
MHELFQKNFEWIEQVIEMHVSPSSM